MSHIPALFFLGILFFLCYLVLCYFVLCVRVCCVVYVLCMVEFCHLFELFFLWKKIKNMQ